MSTSGFCAKSKQAFESVDQFGVSSYLRYGEASSYTTCTGGLLSLILIGVFLSAYSLEIIDTFNKEDIVNHDSIYQEEEPSPYTILGNQSNFIIALGIAGVNLTDKSKTYFDVTIKEGYYENASKIYEVQTSSTKLTSCERQSWMKLGQVYAQRYDTLKINTFLCPPKDYVLELMGKYSSKKYKYWKMQVKECDSSVHSNCASQSEMQSILSSQQYYKMDLFFINTAINTNSHDLVTYYLEDRYYWELRENIYYEGKMYIRQHSVQTDQSILPYKKKRIESYYNLQKYIDIYERPKILDDKIYWQMILRKSGEKIVSTRSFTKLFQLFGDIGGIFSFATLAFFLFYRYDKYCYELEMADRVFTIKHGKTLNSQDFNFWTFIKLYFYELLTQRLGLDCKIEHLQTLSKSRREIKRRLNINNIICNLLFLDKCMRYILKDYQFKMIHFQQKFTLEESEANRLDYEQTQQFKKIYEYIQGELNKSINKNILKHIMNQNMRDKNEELQSPLTKKRLVKRVTLYQLDEIFSKLQRTNSVMIDSPRNKNNSLGKDSEDNNMVQSQKELLFDSISNLEQRKNSGEEEKQKKEQQNMMSRQIIQHFRKLIRGAKENQLYSYQILKNFYELEKQSEEQKEKTII